MADHSHIIEAIQRHLGIDPDGIAGPKTWAAISAALGVGASEPPATETAVIVTDAGRDDGKFDSHTEERIASLALPVQPLARRLLTLASKEGIDLRVVSGYRDYDEQNKLYEIGRTRPNDNNVWKTVTQARGGHSNHNFALAFDVGIFEDGRYIDDFQPERELSGKYSRIGELGKSIGLLWGGDWGAADMPHFEFRPQWAGDLTEAQALAAYRARHEAGKSLFA